MAEQSVDELKRRVQLAKKYAIAAVKEAAIATQEAQFEAAAAMYEIAARQMLKAHEAQERLDLDQVRL